MPLGRLPKKNDNLHSVKDRKRYAFTEGVVSASWEGLWLDKAPRHRGIDENNNENE